MSRRSMPSGLTRGWNPVRRNMRQVRLSRDCGSHEAHVCASRVARWKAPLRWRPNSPRVHGGYRRHPAWRRRSSRTHHCSQPRSSTIPPSGRCRVTAKAPSGFVGLSFFSMNGRQSCTHSSQMKTPGPATSVLTSVCAFPQKEQRCSRLMARVVFASGMARRRP